MTSDDDPFVDVGELDRIPRRGCRVVLTEGDPIAVFRTHDDEVFALDDRCPHAGGPLSQGFVHGRRVTCPLHGTQVCLATGRARLDRSSDATVRIHATRVTSGRIALAPCTAPAGRREARQS